MFACRPSACMITRLNNSVRTSYARNFHFHSRNGARRLQDKAWWLLPAALLTGGYGYYKYRHQLWSIPRVNAAGQLNDKDKFRVTVAANDKNENMDLTKDAGEWMPQAKDIGVTNTRRAVVFTIGMGGFILAVVMTRYRRCPSNKVLVVYGRGIGMPTGQLSRTLHGGGTIVLPVLQDYRYLSLEPMQLDIGLKGALSLENIRVNVPSVFTVAIGTDNDMMQNAAIRLLTQESSDIKHGAEEIILGQLRQVVASMEIQEITRNREKFVHEIERQVGNELKKIGLILINVNIRDITDESGFIKALGQKAASEAINQAKIDVSEREKVGAIGVAKAQQEMKIQVAEAEKDQAIGMKQAEKDSKVRVAALRAQAISGENEAEMKVAESNASLQIKRAGYYQNAETKERQAHAAVQEAEYLAQAKANLALAEKTEAEKRAELEAPALAMKRQTIVDSEAEREKVKIVAQGEAEAIVIKQEAIAKGQYALLKAKADGLGQILNQCNRDSQAAFKLLMLDHLDHLSEQTAKAISNIKFDKVVVWDGGKGSETNAAADFIRGVAHSVPPTLDILKDIGGVDIPQYIGSLQEKSTSPEQFEHDPPEQPTKT